MSVERERRCSTKQNPAQLVSRREAMQRSAPAYQEAAGVLRRTERMMRDEARRGRQPGPTRFSGSWRSKHALDQRPRGERTVLWHVAGRL